MLELRPGCECCDRDLPPESTEARICSYECTFCVSCVEGVLQNVCPNCGGGLEKRPVRPAEKRQKHPASGTRVFKPLEGARLENHRALLARYGKILPEQR